MRVSKNWSCEGEGAAAAMQKLQDPNTKIQRSFKHQDPNSSAEERELDFEVWIFSGSWILELGSFLTGPLLTLSPLSPLARPHPSAGSRAHCNGRSASYDQSRARPGSWRAGRGYEIGR